MKRKARRALGQYVRDTADVLGLRDWYIIFQVAADEAAFDRAESASDYAHEDEPGKKTAACEAVEGQKLAIITLNPRSLETDGARSAEDCIRAAVVHELVHCHLSAVQHQCTRDITPLMVGQGVYDQFAINFVRNLEYAVDGLAQALEPLVPPFHFPGG